MQKLENILRKLLIVGLVVGPIKLIEIINKAIASVISISNSINDVHLIFSGKSLLANCLGGFLTEKATKYILGNSTTCLIKVATPFIGSATEYILNFISNIIFI